MQCVSCGATVIGSIPNPLYGARLCPTCSKANDKEQGLKQEEIEKKQKVAEVKKKGIAEEEKIDNRFDILDM